MMPTRNENSIGAAADQPSVGIFWMIKSGSSLYLLTHRTPVGEAEDYGDCLTHEGGHFEFWERLKARGAPALAKHGLPQQIAFSEYEDFPRGRIVYRKTDETYIIYADRRLQGHEAVLQIVTAFGLSASIYVVKSDAHYKR